MGVYHWNCHGLVFLVLANRKCLVSVGGIYFMYCSDLEHGTWNTTRINLGTSSVYHVHVTLGIRVNPSHHIISFCSYADDTQLYLSFKPPDTRKLALHSCLHDIKCRMSQNLLKCNSDKTEALSIGPEHVSKQIQPLPCPLIPNIKSAKKTLGVILDNNLSLE